MIRLGRWTQFPKRSDTPVVAGISGGRTSAMMAALSDPTVTLCFQNTGREHPKTYDFLLALEQHLGREVVWLEFRPGAVGAPPQTFGFERVTHETAARKGEPFAALLAAIAAYRATKGLGPIAPWARGRICTAYLKHRTQAKYMASLGFDAYDVHVGLRFDEPQRVAKIRSTQDVLTRAPLFEAGITKQDVDGFWRAQDFDLGIPAYLGNCTGCFLKDQSDLARALHDPATDAPWWVEMEQTYPGFGGRLFAGYKRLYDEAPVRQRIETTLRAGGEPGNGGELPARRFKNVVRQERRRLAGELEAFSCSCESAELLGDSDPETEEKFILSLPEAA